MMHGLTATSIRRPVTVVMFTGIVILLGLASLTRLPIDLFPEITHPVITVSTTYSNASPEESERLVTRVVEEAVASVTGVTELTSVSGEGISNVRVSFDWGTDLDVASNDIRDRLDRAARRLPDDADRPQLRKFDLAATPIVFLGVSGDFDPISLRELADNQVKYRLEQVPGVASADVWGGLEREIQVNLDIEKVRALGIPLDRILDAIRQFNVNVPTGTIERGRYDITLRTPGEFTNLDELRDTVIMMREGAPVRLGQLADVEDTHQRLRRLIRINGEPGIRMAVQKQSGTNTVQVAQAVMGEVDRINRDFPQIRVIPVIDTSEFIQQAIDNTTRMVMIGGSLAVLILLLFLRNIRSTLIVASAIPISVIATFMLIYGAGFTLNLMTLGGLALGVGMMVDNAIVVLENIFRVRETGGAPIESALQGTGEVSAAITASTATTLVIFLPMFFVEGIAGILFRPMAFVIGFALICALLVALTLLPMLASRMLGRSIRRRKDDRSFFARFQRGGDRFFAQVEEVYSEILALALRFRMLTIGLIVAIFAGSLMLFPLIGTEFIPGTDQGEVRVSVTMETGTRLEVLDEFMRRVEAIVDEAVPEKETSLVSMGASGWRPQAAASGNVRLSLVPLAERERSDEDVAQALRRELADIPGAEIRVRTAQGMFRMGAGGEESLQVEVRGYELDVLDTLAEQVSGILEDVDGVTDVRISRDGAAPQELFRIDRDRASDLGLSVSGIARALETSVAGSRAGEFRQDGNEYNILVRLRQAERLGLQEILDLTISNDRGEPVVLRNVVYTEPQLGPVVIERKNQERVIYVSANIAGRDLGSIAEDARAALRGIPTPPNYHIHIGGEFEDQQEAFRDLLMALALSLLLVYMVLASLYESFRDPLVVMFSVPFATIGVLLVLFLTGTTLNAQSLVGVIMLGGIVVNNAILLVDVSRRLYREQGWHVREAVLEAGRRRFRPILMTTLTTSLGLLPLAIGVGEGGEAQAPLARTVIGGLLSSTIVTLFLIPTIYTLFNRKAYAPVHVEEPRQVPPEAAGSPAK